MRHITVNKERVPLPDIARFIERWVLPISLLIGIFFGLGIWESWEVILQYRYQVPFAEADPVFGRNIAFYFFTLPLLELIAQLLFMFVIVCLIGAGVLYVLRGGISLGGKSPQIKMIERARLHADKNMVFAQSGFGHVFIFQDFRPAEFVEANSFHRNFNVTRTLWFTSRWR